MSGGTVLLFALAGWALLAVMMTFAWVIERRTNNAGWIDVGWTVSVGVTGAVLAIAVMRVAPDTSPVRGVIVTALALLWSWRLSGHLFARTRTKPDDPRYAKMKAEWGEGASRGMFRMAHIQAAISIPLVLAIALGAGAPAPGWRILDTLAVLVAIAAIAGEGLADRQLEAFRSRPENHGRFCDEGLWSWSRHPNYFFEWLLWVSFALFALPTSASQISGALAILAPGLMYVLLTRVSGVPMLEEHMRAKYGDSFARYSARTSVFFPLPPRIERNPQHQKG